MHVCAVTRVHLCRGARVVRRKADVQGDQQAGLRHWIKSNLNRRSKPAKGLASAMGLHPSQVVQMLKPGGRGIQVHEVQKIVDYIGSSPPPGVWRVGAATEADSTGTRGITPTRRVRIVAVIAPGAWRDADADFVRPVGVSIPEDADPRLEGFEQYACWIEQPRSYAICIPYFEYRKKPVHNDLVHVRRTNKAQQVENTMRKVTVAKGKAQLILQGSGSPNDKSLAYPPTNPDEQVEIVGFVVGVYTKTF